MLGPGNERAAVEALEAFPGGLQIGGGLNKENVRDYLNRGASHVIVTSALFQKDKLHLPRLKELSSMVGKEKLVVDLSCRRRGADYWVVMDRWQTFTDLKLDPETFGLLGKYCDEFLVHAADVEGLCQGIDLELVQNLAAWTTRPTTYAGGAKSLDDLILGTRAGKGKIDITIGSALDIFGGSGVRYRDVVRFNRKAIAEKSAGVKGAGN